MEFFNYISDNALILIPVLYIQVKMILLITMWKHFIEDPNPDIDELQDRVKDLKDVDDITMMALTEADNNTNAINELYLIIEDLYALKGGE